MSETYEVDRLSAENAASILLALDDQEDYYKDVCLHCGKPLCESTNVCVYYKFCCAECQQDYMLGSFAHEKNTKPL